MFRHSGMTVEANLPARRHPEARASWRASKDGRTYCADEQHPSRRAEDGAHLTGERSAFVPGMTVVLVAPHKAAQPDHGFTFQTANTLAHSRGSIRPSFANSSAPKRKRAHATLKRGRGEDRVRAAPAVSCAKVDKKNAHEHTGSAETLRPSPRNGFTAYFVLSPVRPELVCHRRPQEA
jgi:hypothetical protein